MRRSAVDNILYNRGLPLVTSYLDFISVTCNSLLMCMQKIVTKVEDKIFQLTGIMIRSLWVINVNNAIYSSS